MFENFRLQLQKFIQINEDEFTTITPFFKLIQVRKKENLLIEGAICKSHYFMPEPKLK